MGSGNTTTLIISNDEIEDVIKIVKYFEYSGSLLKRVTETVQNEVKEQKRGFLSILLGILGASLLGNLLTGQGAIVKSQGRGINRAGNEIQKYYQNEPRFNNVYSRDHLTEIKDGAYIINLNEYSDIGTHWVALYVHNDVTYFDSFGAEHYPKEIKAFINNKNITTNIFKIKAYDSILC